MTAPRRLQLRRGNATAVSTYTGAAGEVVINTTDWTLRVHDGSTVGGYVVTANTTSLNANITQANLGMKGYVDSVASQSIYGNSNVKSYLTSGFDGNILPSANVTYSLGSPTRQWRDLFVSNTTIYIGGVPLSIDASGTLLVNGNVVQGAGGTTYSNVNVAAYLTTEGYAKTSDITTANIGLKGYVDQANTIQSAQVGAANLAITAANIGMKGYVDQQISDLIGGAPSILDTLNEIAASINDDANVYTSLTNSIATANTALKGYVDQANTIQSEQLTSANIGMKGYVDNAVATIVIPVTYSNVNVKAYTETMGFANYGNVNVAAYLSTQGISSYSNVQVGVYTDLSTYAWNANITAANVGMKGYVDNAVSTIVIPVTYSNVNVAAYLTTNSYLTNTTANLANYAWNANVSGGGSNYSNVNVQAYTETMAFKNYSNVNVAAYLNATGYNLYSNVNVAVYLTTATITTTGNITAGNLITSGALYVANITTTGSSGNISGANYITANYFVGNGSQLTGLPSGYSNVQTKAYVESIGLTNYSNVNAKAYTESMAFTNYSNVNVASYLSTATITTTGNITAQNLTGNISITGNVTGTSANVTLQAGSYSSVFDNQGNVRLPSAYVTANVTANYFVGNGALLTGIVAGSSYSNVQVATYLPTYTGVVTASNVAVAGNVTAQYLFGNGSQLTGIVAGSSYSNVQVATYLPTYSGNIANVRLGVSGVLTFADGTTLATASAISGSTYGNGNVASYLITNGYVNTNSAYANGNVASYLITNQYINTNSAYGNGNVTSYLPTHSGNVGVNNLIGTTPNVTLVANSYSTTYDIYGNVAFGNAAYPVQIYATGSITTNSNLTVGSMGVVMPNRPAFRVNGTAAPITTANVNLKGSAITTVFNQGNYLDTTTGKFTAPIAGIYEVLLNARVGSYNGLSQIAVLKNGNNSQGNIVCFWEIGSTTGTANHFGVSGTINLVAGEYLSANILTGNISFDGNDNWCVTYLG